MRNISPHLFTHWIYSQFNYQIHIFSHTQIRIHMSNSQIAVVPMTLKLDYMLFEFISLAATAAAARLLIRLLLSHVWIWIILIENNLRMYNNFGAKKLHWAMFFRWTWEVFSSRLLKFAIFHYSLFDYENINFCSTVCSNRWSYYTFDKTTAGKN